MCDENAIAMIINKSSIHCQAPFEYLNYLLLDNICYNWNRLLYYKNYNKLKYIFI